MIRIWYTIDIKKCNSVLLEQGVNNNMKYLNKRTFADLKAGQVITYKNNGRKFKFLKHLTTGYKFKIKDIKDDYIMKFTKEFIIKHFLVDG